MNLASSNEDVRLLEVDIYDIKESLYTGEPMRQQKNLVIPGYRVEFY